MMNRASKKTGFTLIEVLISLTMTLIVLGAMLAAFKYASGEMAKGRAAVEMSKRVLVAEELLREDLQRLTLDPRPWTQTADPIGYFEYIEGTGTDSSTIAPGTATVTANDYLGDLDDVLAMTIRTNGEPFRGRGIVGGAFQEVNSDYAEVVWFTVHFDRDNDGIVDFDEGVDLCRRQLLIVPGADTLPYNADSIALSDISYRVEYDTLGNPINLIPNTLEDLANRANRFCHDGGGAFPFLLNRVAGNPPPALPVSLENTRRGAANPVTGVVERTADDVVLTNVIAFDLRVYLPDAAVEESGSIYVEPDDVGSGVLGGATTLGAFVDLSTVGSPLTSSGFTATQYVYDTWSRDYELGGSGLDGVDNDGDGAVDELDERVALPPYLKPLTGLQATIRVIEKNTKQIRQSSVIQSFIPE